MPALWRPPFRKHSPDQGAWNQVMEVRGKPKPSQIDKKSPMRNLASLHRQTLNENKTVQVDEGGAPPFKRRRRLVRRG